VNNAAFHLALTLALCTALVRPLARARWVWRSPEVGILLWQMLALTWVLCVVGTAFAIGLSPFGRDIPTAVSRWLAGQPGLTPPHLVALGVGVGLVLWLVAGMVTSWVGVLRVRRRHRRVLALVAREDEAVPGVLVLDHPLTVAYCLPGLRAQVVLSSGTLLALEKRELAAVVAHERAHARERHDLVLLPFAALRGLFPLVRTVSMAAEAVALLVEMRADERACRREGAGSLAAALHRFGSAPAPQGAIGMADAAVEARLSRLRMPPTPLPLWLRWLVLVTGLMLVSTPLSFLAV
jgi:Zn-dependent protease with chaperone function